MSEGGGELSHFESLSAVTPKKIPIAILVGAALMVPLLWVINLLMPSEGVADLKEAEQKAEQETAAPAAQSADIDDI